MGSTVRLIPVEQVHFMRSDEKYTLVVWDGGEALIRKTIRELADELDPERYVQIHRSVIVNLARVTHVTRGLNETADVHLDGRTETLAGQPQLPAPVPADVNERNGPLARPVEGSRAAVDRVVPAEPGGSVIDQRLLQAKRHSAFEL